MQDYLTVAGLAVVNAGQYQRITSFKLGSSFNYTPDSGDSDIRGTLIYTGSVTDVTVISANLVKISIVLPATSGPFTYGEVGIFLDDSSLFSLSAWGQSITKQVQTTDPDGVASKIDIYVDVTGGTAAINTGTTESRLDAVTSHVLLPNPAEASNFYIFPDPADALNTIIAYSTGLLWSFDSFTKATSLTMNVAATTGGFTVSSTTTGLVVGTLVQIANGNNKGQVRRIANVTIGGPNTAVTYDTPLLVEPSLGDSVFSYKRNTSAGNDVVSPMVSTFDMGNYRITNVATPTGASDAVTKGYADSSFIGRAGTGAPTANISWASFRLTNLGNPVAGTDAANKDYVDSVAVAGGFAAGTTPATGNPNFGGNKGINVGAPTVGTDATNKTYVDTLAAARLPLTGGTMSGTLNLGGNLLSNVAPPVNPGDAVSRSFADTNYIRTNGSNSMTANLDLGNNRIVQVAVPTVGSDVANKTYVDNEVQKKAAKDPVACASVGNINVSAPGGTFDGYSPSVGERLLLKNQSAASENGIYVFNGSGLALTRAPDFNSNDKAVSGSMLRVVHGTANAGTEWFLSTTGAIVLGTTALTWTQITAGSGSGVVLANGTVAFTGNANLGTYRITNLGAPASPTDAVNRGYIDAQINPASVRVASTGNIDLSAPGAAVDGLAFNVGNRFLAKNQTVGSQNGIYIWNGPSVAATRAPDFDSVPAIHYGALVEVQFGTINGASVWKLTTTSAITVGITVLTFSNTAAAAGVMPDGSVPMTGNLNLATNRILNLANPIADADGATKVYVDTATLGKQPISVRVASTASLTISGPGSSIDGVTLNLNDLFLAKNQASALQNGVYVWNGASSAATRFTGYNAPSHITNAALIAVQEGTVNADSLWTLTTNSTPAIVVGSTQLAYQRVDAINAVRIDGSQAFTANQSLGSNRLINLANATEATDATPREQVEWAGRGFLLRAPVNAASTGNVSIGSPGASIDSLAMSVGMRVLLKNQTAGSENGIYTWNGPASSMTRTSDFNSSATAQRGVLVRVLGGATHSNQYWCHLTTNHIVTIGSTSLLFVAVDPITYDLKNLPRVFVSTTAVGSYFLDINQYEEFQLTLTGNVTFAFPGNVIPGTKFILKLRQDGVGSRTVTFPASVRFNGSVPSYVHTGTANSIDLIGFRFDFIDGKYDVIALVKALA